ncbi:ChaN family lipoprotein [Pendulispora brunnea]|uniref:ChaN family lipoprotein n=1 Tax=Pendulispora brunnea TaxID=2905690 RepID=A0ABZ2KIJ9_9BACT
MKWFQVAAALSAALVCNALACNSEDSSPAPDTSTELELSSDLVGKLFTSEKARTTYWEAVGKPSPYLTDYYGLHVLQPLPKETVLRQLVPAMASLVEDRGNSVSLLLEGGYSMVLHFNKALSRRGGGTVDSGHDYALFDAPDEGRLLAALEAFYALLQKHQLTDAYLLPNVHYDLEQAVVARAAEVTERITMTQDPDRSRFRHAGADAVLVVPDAVHGDEARYREIFDVLQHEPIDWFGIEMYPRREQPAIDAYLSEPDGSPAFEDAKERLLAVSWKTFAEPNPLQDNHYLRLLDICRQRKIRVHGMDIEPAYSLWGHGETPFGSMVRNLYWVASLPPSGRGVLFGGSAHFYGNSLVLGHPLLFVQDFLAPVYRGEKLFVLETKHAITRPM